MKKASGQDNKTLYAVLGVLVLCLLIILLRCKVMKNEEKYTDLKNIDDKCTSCSA